ncbi:MAG: PilW family protein [Chromatiales bacterium]|nr:PilW family protein [Chromatiales bacterium]
MVAMTIGLVFMLTLTAVLSNNSRTRNELELASRQIENGRYAIQILTEDLRHSGFFGEAGFSPVGHSTGHVQAATACKPPPALCPPAFCPTIDELVDDFEDYLGFPLVGESRATAPACGGAALDFLARAALPNDILLIRRTATSCTLGPGCTEVFTSGLPYLQLQACAPNAGEVLVIKPNAAADLTAQTRRCDEPAPAYQLLNRLYYIAANNRPGDGIPTLKRVELESGGYRVTPLVEGIEYLHFEYDAGDGNGFRAAAAMANLDWPQVLAVRIHLIARDTRPSLGYQDNKIYRFAGETLGGTASGAIAIDTRFRRQVLTATVRLVNMAGNRE